MNSAVARYRFRLESCAARGSVQQSFYDTSPEGGAWCYRWVMGVAETSLLLCDVCGMALLSHSLPNAIMSTRERRGGQKNSDGQ